MKRLILLSGILVAFAALSLTVVAQNKLKAKGKTTKTKPVSKPTYIGETEKNLSKAKVQPKTKASVFETNDANTWIEAHEFDVAIKGQNSTQSDSSTVGGKPNQKGVAQGGVVKKPIVFNDVVVSSKTSKPKRKPTKVTTSKRKPQ